MAKGILFKLRVEATKQMTQNWTFRDPRISESEWLSATSSKNLLRLQNRAARIVLRRDSFKDTFNVLGWAELETKRKRHKCVLVYKCLNNLVPQYLRDYFTRNYNVHSYNTCRKTDLHLP